MSDKYSAPIGC
uniref:Uncharacterized protein n=1 Tax=Anguilla anguilla TaxID=7936 RepID=A0A0E9UXJ9_ANGAN